jgi:hypothetical protein
MSNSQSEFWNAIQAHAVRLANEQHAGPMTAEQTEAVVREAVR